MTITREVIAVLAGVALASTACKGGESTSGGGQESGATAVSVTSAERILAGGVQPPPGALSKARPAKVDAAAGGNLFGALNCDGCHGGGAVGWVGPSLVDGRWRYGGRDEDIFTSIYYGRPKGMPAYGGVIGTDGVWTLVAYIRSQSPPSVVPTTSWLPGGNATATPPAPNPPGGPAAEEKASPSGTEQAKANGSAPDSGQAQATASVKPEDMPAKYGCTACHAVDHKVIGPAFKDVAAKYKGQDVEAKLVAKVRNGGAGVWGQTPMVPNPQVPDADLHALVKWILSLK
jgi:cytochrome c